MSAHEVYLRPLFFHDGAGEEGGRLAGGPVRFAKVEAELKKMAPMWEEMKDRGLNVYAVSTDGPDTASRVAGSKRQVE